MSGEEKINDTEDKVNDVANVAANVDLRENAGTNTDTVELSGINTNASTKEHRRKTSSDRARKEYRQKKLKKANDSDVRSEGTEENNGESSVKEDSPHLESQSNECRGKMSVNKAKKKYGQKKLKKANGSDVRNGETEEPEGESSFKEDSPCLEGQSKERKGRRGIDRARKESGQKMVKKLNGVDVRNGETEENDGESSVREDSPCLEDHVKPKTKRWKQQKKKKEKTKEVERSEPEDIEDEREQKKDDRQDRRRKDQEDKQISKKKGKRIQEMSMFPSYIPPKEMEQLLKNTEASEEEYVKGYLRINPKNFKHAYVTQSEQNLLILSISDRNRALDGDLVVAKVNPPDRWLPQKNGKRKTGTIVCILDKIHPRKVLGFLRQNEYHQVLFQPRDNRLPILRILPDCLPKHLTLPNLFDNTLCIAKIQSWERPLLAFGKLKTVIGNIGDMAVESRAILLENDLDVSPYSQALLNNLPPLDYEFTEEDLSGREDWRDECVFTIDPATAVDLDDAVSCKVLENGNYEIGVHIADVTHFLQFQSALDIQVAKRATTVYMTDRVYHMLPQKLCHVCSLIPNQDKLTFSVIWEMTKDAEVIKHRFAKTVIRSRYQMSYQQAQKIIENETDSCSNDLLGINDLTMQKQITDTVKSLYKLSILLRKKRFNDGALKIDQLKLHVNLDRDTGTPCSFYIEEQLDSNRLIEEFMLLANITVATHLSKKLPEPSLLRNHRQPMMTVLTETKNLLEKFGVHLDIDSAKSLQASVDRYTLDLKSDCEHTRKIAKYRMMVIHNLCAKAMQRATYISSSTVDSETGLRHYALNVPLYTHFTSPIRRYADCTVHRLLYASIKGKPPPKEWTEQLCASIATNCNVKKYSAKLAQEASTRLYFASLANLMGSFVTIAVVTGVRGNVLDAILCDIGLKLKVQLTKGGNIRKVQYSTEYSVPAVMVSWKCTKTTQMITLFSLIHLLVDVDEDRKELLGTLLPAKQNGLINTDN